MVGLSSCEGYEICDCIDDVRLFVTFFVCFGTDTSCLGHPTKSVTHKHHQGRLCVNDLTDREPAFGICSVVRHER